MGMGYMFRLLLSHHQALKIQIRVTMYLEGLMMTYVLLNTSGWNTLSSRSFNVKIFCHQPCKRRCSSIQVSSYTCKVIVLALHFPSNLRPHRAGQ